VQGQLIHYIAKPEGIARSHGSASFVRATTQVDGEMGNSTPRHTQTP